MTQGLAGFDVAKPGIRLSGLDAKNHDLALTGQPQGLHHAQNKGFGVGDEMIGGQKAVQAFSRQKAVQARFDEINEKLEKASLRAVFFSSITNPATRFVNGIVYAVVALAGLISLPVFLILKAALLP